MRGTRTRILKKYNRRRSRCYSKKSKRHTRKNIYSKTYKKIQKGGFFCDKEKTELAQANKDLEQANRELAQANRELEKANRELAQAKREIKILRDALTGLSDNNSELLKKLEQNVKSSPEYVKMKENVTLYEEGNKKLQSEILMLKRDIYKLTMELNKLREQKMPTEEQVNAVTLDHNDNIKIDKMLDTWYSDYVTSVGHDIGLMETVTEDKEKYKANNKERAIREYKKEKFMKENPQL